MPYQNSDPAAPTTSRQIERKRDIGRWYPAAATPTIIGRERVRDRRGSRSYNVNTRQRW